MVLDIHGLCYNPGHWVRVFAEDLDLKIGWSSLMVLLLVVPDEALSVICFAGMESQRNAFL